MINQPVSPYPKVLAFLTAHFSADGAQYVFQVVKKGKYPYSLRLLGSGIIPSSHVAHHITLDIKADKTPQLKKLVENTPPDWTPFQGGSHFTTLKITHGGNEYNALISSSAMSPDNIIVHADLGPNNTIDLTFVKMHANWWWLIALIAGALIFLSGAVVGAHIKSLKECIPSSQKIGMGGEGPAGDYNIGIETTTHSPKVIVEQMPGQDPPPRD